MSKGAYVGVNGKARKITNGYVGVNGVARKITKAYVGVGGVARPFWCNLRFAYYGTAASLNVPRMSLASANAGNYALFAGGQNGSVSDSVTTVDAYNASLTRSNPTPLSVSRSLLAGAQVGNYALFAGGFGSSNRKNTVDAYNASLTRSNPTALKVSRDNSASVCAEGYAIFAGGQDSGSWTGTTTVDAYNASLTRSNPTPLSVSRIYLAGAKAGNYSIFAGGLNNDNRTGLTTVDAYNASLTRSNPTALSQPKHRLAGGTVGEYALFAGGVTNYFSSNTVEAYDASLTQLTIPNARSIGAHPRFSTIKNEYAIMAAGYTTNLNWPSKTVLAFDASLTITVIDPLPEARCMNAISSTGDYTLIAGGTLKGETTDSMKSDVFVYEYKK